MQGRTDRPVGSRPNCPQCGEHRWSFHSGECLSPKCKPLSEWMKEIEATNKRVASRKRTEPLVDPTTGAVRKKPTGKSRREAEEWYKATGKDIPWE